MGEGGSKITPARLSNIHYNFTLLAYRNKQTDKKLPYFNLFYK